MARISLQSVHKRYGQGAQAHHALRDVSLTVEPGEFIALLGPSGSGKTTLLRAIAGLEVIDSGNICIGAEVVAAPGRHVPPEARNVGVVFQNHALWPHMTVLQNVLFPLREAGVAPAQRAALAQQTLQQVGLNDLGARMPGELSGGQKQRVSLARAMVASPRVILFDEPLASLDVELRRDMMRLITRARTGNNTMVYVTHNQEEALALADRVVVLADGAVQQIATPRALCLQPHNAMVAGFVGGGNCLTATVTGSLSDGRVAVTVGDWSWLARSEYPVNPGQRVQVCVAANAFDCVSAYSPGLLLALEQVFFLGASGYSVDAMWADGDAERVALNLQLPLQTQPRRGDCLKVQIHDAWVLPQQTG
jgi:iron(III) transport system ATP-binding protein